MKEDALTDTQIRQLIDTYTPSAETVKLLDDNGIVVFVGVTGAGKNTIMDALVASGEFHDVITATTRLPRENNGVMEQDGVEYYFITVDQAIEKMRAGEYAEVSWVHNRVNGVLASELQKATQLHKTMVIDVDIQGALKFRSLSHGTRLVFVTPPSFEEWDRRNRNRYASDEDFKADWPARRQSAIMELECALDEGDKFALVVNRSLEDAVQDVRTILAEGHSLAKQQEGKAAIESILAVLKAD